MDTDMPIQDKPTKPKASRSRRTEPDIKYDIVSDVLKQKANIEIGDLITVAPTLRRKLVVGCKPKRKLVQGQMNQTMAIIEDEELNTTAVYSIVGIGNKNIKALVDCGASKACISKPLADTLGLEIDAASENIFTLGNGTKQTALGIIYDVPIEVTEDLIIPCNLEVLPSCPSHLILGNNWLNRAKARIDFNSSSLKVKYKSQKAEIPIHFIRRNTPIPKVKAFHQDYQHPISLTNSNVTKHVHFEDDESEESYSADTEEESTSEDEGSSEENDELEVAALEKDYDNESLQVLENDNEVIITNLQGTYSIKATVVGLMIQAHSSKHLQLDKPKNDFQDIVYNFEITHPKLTQSSGYFDQSSTCIVNKKSIDIHIYNRTKDDIFIEPGKEIGLLEICDLNKDTLISAYDINNQPTLCTLEQDYSKHNSKEDFQDTLEPQLSVNLEIGDIKKSIKEELMKLLHRYKHIFDWNNDTIGKTKLISHKIILEEDTLPISHRPYRISPLESEHLQKELEKYCKLGVISPSNSPWAAPVILVKKKNGDYRMVIDYRKLNAKTKKDAYPLPRIDDLLDTLGKAKVFSALDMRSGFHQVPLEEASKDFTAFTTKYGTYHYNTLPMGLVNSPATFQRLIDLCFRPLINKCLVAYIDDLNVYSFNEQEHLIHLEQVFKCIEVANLKLNPEKCFFFKDHLKFLGYIVTSEGIQTDPDKIKKIVEHPIPTTTTQVRSFLGIASYYRRFIKDFAAIARPLHDQTKTKKKIPWTEDATKSFETLKKLLTTAPVLARPDFNKNFILVTDASKLGLGCVLTQLDDDEKEHPIIFASRGLKPNEVNYAPTKLECLAVVWAVKLFRPYILGKKFMIITDHSALTGLLKTPNPTGIIARWIVTLSEYDFEIKYRPGRVNESADFLSRLGY
ncbi:hypothetical protein G6F17_011811 [Rhizopus arrhizus]|nr:hypothetical protein G6F17_011811 [Rhizopus arrhizus]